MPIDEALDDPNQNEDLESRDDRRPQRLLDSRRQADGELSDSDDEGEGGRRNHARHHGRDSVDRPHTGDGSSRKFGMGVGIMTSGSTTTHGAGPSGHNTAARILSTSLNTESTTMDVDNINTPENGTSEPQANKSTAGSDDMVLDGSSGSNT